MTTSPRPWRTGTSASSEGLTFYSHEGDTPRGKILGFVRDPDDAEHLVKAVNFYDSRLDPSPVEEDLRKGFYEANRRWRIAAVVAGHHQEQLAFIGPEIIDAFEAVLSALGGKTDPDTLRIRGNPVVMAQVQVVIDSTSGEAGRG